MKKTFLSFALLAIFGISALAQSADEKWSVGLFAGKNEYNGELGNGILNFNKAAYVFGALSLNRYLNPSFDLGLEGSYGAYGYYENMSDNFWGMKTQGDLLIKYKLSNGYIFKADAKFAPYIAIGVGAAGYTGTRIVNGGTDMVLPVGAGIKYNISGRIAIQYQALYNFTNSDKRDGDIGTKDDKFLAHTLGVVFSFGKPKDTDGDGVPDYLDKCPNTPKGVAVDKTGCPIDTDGDGVPDYLDKCPNTPKGVAVDKNGCPIDTDGDGVPDYLDKCPGTPAGVAVDKNGCPIDSDGDGVPDYLDKCPNTPAGVAVDKDGCPIDTDGDGVPDYLDKCPNTPKGVAVDKDGCPLVSDETKKVFEQALTGVQFETGKDVIKKTSYTILDNVVKIMKENPSYLLGINGYTDNQGNAAKNMTLSQNRANAVKKYIADKGVDAARMTPTGFGITNPIADNATAEGRAKNRRVEFKVSFNK